MKRRSLAALAIGAGVLVLVAAVALVRSSRPSASVTAAPPDASEGAIVPALLPSAAARATVRVFDDGAPMEDRVVVFHRPDGEILATAKTGKNGSAAGPVVAGGMITVAYGSSVKHLVTILGVAANDDIVVGEEEDEGPPGKTVCSANVSLPSLVSGAARYTLALGVNSTDVTDPAKAQRASVFERLVVEGKFRVLGEAWDEHGEAKAFADGRFAGCARDAGAGASSAIVPARLPPWSTDYRSFTIDVLDGARDVPEGTTVSAELVLTPKGADGYSRGRREAPLHDRASLRFLAPRPLGVAGRTIIDVKYAGGTDRCVLDEQRTAIPEAQAIDLGKRLLPRVEKAIVEAPDAGARPTMRFQVSGDAEGAKAADAMVVRIAWPATREHVWTFVAPPDSAPRVTAPVLPPELASWRPVSGSTSVAAALVDASSFAGFADVKRHGLDALKERDGDELMIRYSTTGVGSLSF